MIKYSYPLEKILLALFAFNSLVSFESQFLYIFWTIAVTIAISSYLFQGGRPYTPIFFLIPAAHFLQFHLIQNFLIVLTLLIMIYIKYHQIQIVNKGQYQVGYRQHKFNNIQMAIFYPTISETKPSPWIHSDEYYRTLYDLVFIHPYYPQFVPFWLFKLTVSYLGKMTMPVQENAELHHISSTERKQKKKVIIFSHGLAAHMNNFSSLCGWWASNGYIVVTVQHNNDVIRTTCKKLLFKRLKQLENLFFQNRNKDLLVRAREYEEVLDGLLEKGLLDKIFKEDGAKLEVHDIYLAGQSYGGATALQTMANLRMKNKVDPLIKGLICIDAWYFPLSASTYDNLKDQNMLFINSETFFRQVPYICYLQQKLNRLRQKNQSTLKAFVALKVDHVSISDFAFTIGSVLKYSKFAVLQEHTKQLMAFHQKAITLFMEGKNTQQIKDESNQYAEQLGLAKLGVRLKEQWRFETDPNFINF